MEFDMARMAGPGVAIASLLFGSVGVITHYIDAPSSIIVSVRGVVAIAALLIIMAAIRHRPSRESIGSNAASLLLSGACLGMNWLFLFEAYKITDVSIAVLCNNMCPAIIILLSPLFFTERLNLTKIGCTVLAVIGLVMSSGVITVGLSEEEFLGVAYGVASAFFAAFMIMFNRKLKSITPMDKTIVQLIVATAIVGTYSLVTIDLSTLVVTDGDLLLMVILGIFQTAVAFTLYFGSAAHLRSDTFALYAYIEPVSALVLSAVILGEDLGIVGIIGAVLILGSTYLCEKLESRRNGRAAPHGPERSRTRLSSDDNYYFRHTMMHARR